MGGGLNSYTLNFIHKSLSSKFFFVRVPITATYSEDELRMFGTHTELTGGGEINDKQTIYEFVKVRLPLDRILDIYSQGFRVYVVNEKDIQKIVDHIDTSLIKFSRGHSVDSTGLTDMYENFLKSILSTNTVHIERKLNKESEELSNKFLGGGLFHTVESKNIKPNMNNIKVEFGGKDD